MKISISMIALNEEHFIARALSSCRFADEIVVVDGGSMDRTIEILQAHPKVKVVRHPWKGHFGHQRQVSLQHCSGDWVIRLDADEAFALAFEEEIIALLNRTPEEVEAYRVRQCNLVGNESFFSKSADTFESTPRIWRNRSAIKWQSAIHESLTGFSGTILDWDAYVVHYGFLNRSRFLEKAQKYSEISGSLVNRSEDLVFRDYDFQPVPEKAMVGKHVPPYLLPEHSSGKPRVAVVRGPHLNMSEIHALAPLQEMFDITVYTTRQPAEDTGKSDPPIVCLPKDPRVATAMAGLEYALFDADIVYVPEIVWPYAYQAIMAKEKFGKAAVALQREVVPFAHEENEALRKLKHASREMVDVFVAESEEARDALLIEGVPREKIAVIPMGVNFSEIAQDGAARVRIRHELKIEPSAKVVLYAGDTVWKKGIGDLVYAAKLIQMAGGAITDDIRYLVAAEGSELKCIEKRIEEMGMGSLFRFCNGMRPGNLFNAADIFLMPSIPSPARNTPSGLMLKEAMAFGLPVLAVASGPIPNLVGDAAVLLPVGNPGAISAAITALACDDDRREKQGRMARQHALSRFSIERTVREMTRLFEAVYRENSTAGHTP